jgi:hypothetical protein
MCTYVSMILCVKIKHSPIILQRKKKLCIYGIHFFSQQKQPRFLPLQNAFPPPTEKSVHMPAKNCAPACRSVVTLFCEAKIKARALCKLRRIVFALIASKYFALNYHFFDLAFFYSQLLSIEPII